MNPNSNHIILRGRFYVADGNALGIFLASEGKSQNNKNVKKNQYVLRVVLNIYQIFTSTLGSLVYYEKNKTETGMLNFLSMLSIAQVGN